MTEERRRQLEGLLSTDADGEGRSGGRMSRICDGCVSELNVSGAGATVLTYLHEDGQNHDTRRGLVHASNEVSAGLEDLQLTVGEGPCLDTFASGGPVLVPDLAQASDRWPAFTSQARQLGAAAVFSFPLQLGVIRLGSLDCYRDWTGPLGQPAVADALILADLATQALVDEMDGHAVDDLGWLADPHAEIHQASGMVQVQLNTTTDAALLRLRAHAYAHDLSLSHVARQVVARELRFDTESDPLS